MTIYLIRHGKTEANERHLYCGSTDLPLSDAGKAELQQLHYDIKNVRFLTSGMKRTNETLRILFGDVPYEEDPRFREVDFGIFEMRSYEELKDTPEYQTWLTGDNESNIPPSGESGVQMGKRVLEALADLKEDTCIITHGGVIAMIMENLFPNEGKNRYQWQPGPGMGYVVNGFLNHQHTHTHGHTHEHHHDHTHAPMEELVALMKYMVGHNAAHAKELAELAVKLDEAGSHASYHKVMDAVAYFEKGNEMLDEVLKDQL